MIFQCVFQFLLAQVSDQEIVCVWTHLETRWVGFDFMMLCSIRWKIGWLLPIFRFVDFATVSLLMFVTTSDFKLRFSRFQFHKAGAKLGQNGKKVKRRRGVLQAFCENQQRWVVVFCEFCIVSVVFAFLAPKLCVGLQNIRALQCPALKNQKSKHPKTSKRRRDIRDKT